MTLLFNSVEFTVNEYVTKIKVYLFVLEIGWRRTQKNKSFINKKNIAFHLIILYIEKIAIKSQQRNVPTVFKSGC